MGFSGPVIRGLSNVWKHAVGASSEASQVAKAKAPPPAKPPLHKVATESFATPQPTVSKRPHSTSWLNQKPSIPKEPEEFKPLDREEFKPSSTITEGRRFSKSQEEAFSSSMGKLMTLFNSSLGDTWPSQGQMDFKQFVELYKESFSQLSKEDQRLINSFPDEKVGQFIRNNVILRNNVTNVSDDTHSSSKSDSNAEVGSANPSTAPDKEPLSSESDSVQRTKAAVTSVLLSLEAPPPSRLLESDEEIAPRRPPQTQTPTSRPTGGIPGGPLGSRGVGGGHVITSQGKQVPGARRELSTEAFLFATGAAAVEAAGGTAALERIFDKVNKVSTKFGYEINGPSGIPAHLSSPNKATIKGNAKSLSSSKENPYYMNENFSLSKFVESTTALLNQSYNEIKGQHLGKIGPDNTWTQTPMTVEQRVTSTADRVNELSANFVKNKNDLNEKLHNLKDAIQNSKHFSNLQTEMKELDNLVYLWQANARFENTNPKKDHEFEQKFDALVEKINNKMSNQLEFVQSQSNRYNEFEIEAQYEEGVSEKATLENSLAELKRGLVKYQELDEEIRNHLNELQTDLEEHIKKEKQTLSTGKIAPGATTSEAAEKVKNSKLLNAIGVLLFLLILDRNLTKQIAETRELDINYLRGSIGAMKNWDTNKDAIELFENIEAFDNDPSIENYERVMNDIQKNLEALMPYNPHLVPQFYTDLIERFQNFTPIDYKDCLEDNLQAYQSDERFIEILKINGIENVKDLQRILKTSKDDELSKKILISYWNRQTEGLSEPETSKLKSQHNMKLMQSKLKHLETHVNNYVEHLWHATEGIKNKDDKVIKLSEIIEEQAVKHNVAWALPDTLTKKTPHRHTVASEIQGYVADALKHFLEAATQTAE